LCTQVYYINPNINLDKEIVLGETDPRATVARIINFSLGLIGLLGLLLIIDGIVLNIIGFIKIRKNKDNKVEIEKGKKMNKRGKKLFIIGVVFLVIILTFWGMTKYALCC